MDRIRLRIFFCFFGLESVPCLPPLTYVFLFLQTLALVCLSVFNWLLLVTQKQSSIKTHKTSFGVEAVQNFSIHILCGTILMEAFMRHKRFRELHSLIADIELNSSDLFRSFQKDFLQKLTIFTITLVTTECSYYLSNPSYEKLQVMILLNFYLFFFKHMREFHFIFYINTAVTCLKMIEAELRTLSEDSHIPFLMINKKFRRRFYQKLWLVFDTYYKVRVVFNTLVKLVRGSITIIILQNLLQLTVEFYWIAFGFMNNTSNDDKFLYFQIWPLIPCLLPKIFLPLYMWESCEAIYQLESRIFHHLQTFNRESSTSVAVSDNFFS